MSLQSTHDAQNAVPCWIAGRSVATETSPSIVVESVGQGKVIGHAHSASSQVATEAVESAWEAFGAYKNLTYSQRRSILLKAADNLEAQTSRLVEVQIAETSCHESWAQFNVILAAKALREIAAGIESACTGELLPSDSGDNFCLVHKQPIGPVLCIAPWNGSVILAARSIASPLAAGCTIVFKASELCPLTHQCVTQAFLDAGLPSGALNRIQVRRQDAHEVTESIISNPKIRKIEFIGSAGIGSAIGQMAAKYLKPVLMELGGKCPAIVLEDADLEKAARLCALGAIMHHGQVCMSTERIIVLEKVADQFIQSLRDAFAKHKEMPQFAVTKSMAAKAHELVQSAVDHGASFIIGSNNAQGDSGASLEPTVLAGVARGNPIYDTETFGPSATVYIVPDESKAIELANESSYGLIAAVHTKDIMRGIRLGKALESGTVVLNGMTIWEEPNMPVGGVKGSGWGKNNGKYGIVEFLITKTIGIVEPS